MVLLYILRNNVVLLSSLCFDIYICARKVIPLIPKTNIEPFPEHDYPTGLYNRECWLFCG